MFLLNVVGYAAVGGVLSILLPTQVRLAAGSGATSALALVTGVAAVASLAVPPIAGVLSDRTRSRWGRRAPWILFGGLGGGAALVVLSAADSVAGLVIGWFLVQGAVNVGLNVVLATIPDRVPAHRHGLASTVQGLGLPIGSVVGVQLGAAFVDSVQIGYTILAVAFALASAVSAWLTREAVVTADVSGRRSVSGELRQLFASLRFRDYRWVFISRAVLYLGFSMVNGFGLYILQDHIVLPPGLTAADGVATALTISLVLTSVGTAVAGPLVDRWGHHRGFVLISSLLLTASLLVPFAWPTWVGFVAGTTIGGLAIGLFLGVDLALATLVLPKAADTGRDLGVFHIALNAPQTIAPFLASTAVTTLGGYPALFLLGAGFALVGSIAVLRVRPGAVSRRQAPGSETT